jgi:hypothetical protein
MWCWSIFFHQDEWGPFFHSNSTSCNLDSGQGRQMDTMNSTGSFSYNSWYTSSLDKRKETRNQYNFKRILRIRGKGAAASSSAATTKQNAQ